MNNCRLIKLTTNNFEPYEIINDIKANENEFKNSAYGLSLEEFKKWLIVQDNWSKGIDLPNGYVPQNIYWLYVNNEPVGMGKIRLALTESSREIGGNIGAAISNKFRGKGYGSILIKLLVDEAKKIGIEEILITVEKYNPASKKATENAGGKVFKENNERWYLTF